MKMKKVFTILLLLFGFYTPAFSAPIGIYLGEFAIGEAFVDEIIEWGDSSPPQKISIIYCGMNGTTVLLYTAFVSESSHLLAPGYRLIYKSSGTYWYFDFGFGVKGDATFTLQQISSNKIKVWREGG